MAGTTSQLVVGELIEIKYRIAQAYSEREPEVDMVDRWIPAQIVRRDADALPMARLADGQITDIRPFMIWRRLA